MHERKQQNRVRDHGRRANAGDREVVCNSGVTQFNPARLVPQLLVHGERSHSEV